jgi:hypothetical protein
LIDNIGLKIKTTTKALDYLSCDVRVDKTNHCAWIGQTTLIKKLEKKFQPILDKLPVYNGLIRETVPDYKKLSILSTYSTLTNQINVF